MAAGAGRAIGRSLPRGLVGVGRVAARQVGLVPVWSPGYSVDVCLKVSGVQAGYLWQALHSRAVCMWPVGLPVAVVPLWQPWQPVVILL